MCIYKYISTHINTYKYIELHINTYVRTYIHTYLRTYITIHSNNVFPSIAVQERGEGFVLSAKHGAVLCDQKDMVTAVRAIYAELGVPEDSFFGADGL